MCLKFYSHFVFHKQEATKIEQEYDETCACEFATQDLNEISDCLSAFESIGTPAAVSNSPVCSGECRESVMNVLNNCPSQV